MTHATKVQPRHLKRAAYLYVRQSTMRQVLENTESTKRQYALRGRAVALGWTDDRIVVVDSDQGESGASAAWREGFQRLVSEVGMGRAGIVMGLEVSRLARNNADWHRLLEICALSDTLILDEDGVYNPAEFNDRLLLGLKGTMSEAELHVLKARLRGGVVNKARRGEYRCPLPVGFVYDPLGNVVLDPDTQVRETIAHFFETFSRVGSIHQTVRTFRQEGLPFPARLKARKGTPNLVFQPLTASAAYRVLHNPRYAGIYAYGRRRYRRTADGKKHVESLELGEWTACIPQAHAGYITRERHEENLRVLATNAAGYDAIRRQPPREGGALLQGLGICGRCGGRLQIRYAARRGRNDVWYVCWRAASSHGAPSCQSIAGSPVDEAVAALVGGVVTPAAIELALEVRREIQQRVEEADRLRSRTVQRAQQDAELARQRYMMVDPQNRLVADTLEADWNQKLRAVATAREEYERNRAAEHAQLDGPGVERLSTLAADFERIWGDTRTPARERKRMIAHIIEDVTLLKLSDEGVTQIHVRFKGGRTETLTTLNPKSSAAMVKTSAEIVAAVDGLMNDHIYAEIARILDERGILPGGSARADRSGRRFTAKRVQYIVHTYGLRSRFDRLRERGLLTAAEMAVRLGISACTLKRWVDHGLVTRHAYDGYSYLYEPPDPNPPTPAPSRWDTLEQRARRRVSAPSSTCKLQPEEV
ncbi:MAG: recombinase family protein [Pseudomonadota bacterium]|nr:recombinase family protein [Candidatus Moranbacteria bacterium]MDP2316508.1 recombinase family protein [Pseudomonadota bacterium]